MITLFQKLQNQIRDIHTIPVGSILGVEISPAGAEPYGSCADIIIAGFTTGKSVDFGSGYDIQLDYSDITSATIVFTVVSMGFDSSGNAINTTRTLYGTSVVRQAYPNQASDNEPKLTAIRIALNEFVYTNEKHSGTNVSGSDPVVSIAAGAIRNDGGLSELSVGIENLRCVNSSGLEYPKSISRWDRVAGTVTADRVKTDFPVACRSYHRFGIACVCFDASGQTSGHTETFYVSTRTKTQRTGSGLYAESYRYPDIPLSGFTQGELIDLRFRSYPNIGDSSSVIDTNNYTTSNQEGFGRNKSTIICDKSGTLDVFAVIDATSGNNTTGVSSSTLATAEASPYLNISPAIEDGANVIYLKDGDHNFAGTTITRKTTNEWIVVTHHPTLSSKANAIVVVNSTTKSYRTERLQYKNVTFKLANTTSYCDGETLNKLRLTGITFNDSTTGAPTTGVGYRSLVTYVDNCDGDMGEQEWIFESFSTTFVHYCIDGCDFNDAETPNYKSFSSSELVACSNNNSNQSSLDETLIANTYIKDNMECSFNIFTKLNNNGKPFFKNICYAYNIPTGLAFIGNVLEKIIGIAQIATIAGDGSATHANNVLIWHNTWVGERSNFGYNDSGSVPYSRRNWSLKYNCLRSFNNKDDTFPTENVNRIGSWPVGYGVGFQSNHYEISTFPGEYGGFDLTLGTAGYVNDQSYTGGGAGNGDYTPDTGSVLIGRIPTGQRVITTDLYGNNIVENGDIGAIQVTT